jgi:guanidinoacetate N-methyltransferase
MGTGTQLGIRVDTVTKRTQIGFPAQPADWAKAPAIYDAHTLRIASHPVMEDWELGYMHALAQIACSNGGSVLEIGYGMGLSAGAIQSHGIETHYVVECHPDVIARCLNDRRQAIGEGRLHVVSGFWQDVTPRFATGSFDGILFDTYPLHAAELHANHFVFFKEAHRLLKPGGVFTYYSDEATTWSADHLAKLKSAGFVEDNIHYEVCDVNPPETCEYWRHKTILAPIVKK